MFPNYFAKKTFSFASSNADVGNRVNKSHVPGPDAQKTELNSTQPAALSLFAAGRWRFDSGRPMRKVRLRAGEGRRGTEAATTARPRGRHQRHTQGGNHSGRRGTEPPPTLGGSLSSPDKLSVARLLERP